MKRIADAAEDDARAGRDTPMSDSSVPESPAAFGDLDESTQGSSGLSGHHSFAGGQFPSMQDLNTRLRRLITSYQKNYKKEELKMQQRAKVYFIFFKFLYIIRTKNG